MTTYDQAPSANTNAHSEEDTLTPPSELQIGAFSGYIRRPLPDRSGMTAQFYGENGEDADMISALSLTKFIEADVYVKIHLIKDSVGQIMKTNGAFPMVAAFKAKVQRPKGLKEGMIANLFAPNGEDADQVNTLGLSKYLDAFVFVEILKPEAAPLKSQQPAPPPSILPEISAELESLTQHLTPYERKALQKKTKAFSEANRALKISGFLRQPALWPQLGSELDYQSWVETCPCCAPGDSPCLQKTTAYKIPMESHMRYGLIPLCTSHSEQANTGAMPGGIAFLRMRRDVLIQEWAWERIKEKVGSFTKIDEPDPQKIFAWAHQHGLTQNIPANYLNKFS